jgi:ketosteroid isomerase-like protein
MSQENVEVIRAVFDTYNARDLDASAAIYASDAVFVPDTSVLPEAVPVHGRHEIRAWLTETATA